MAKIQIKSEKLTPFGGFFRVMEQFDSTLSSVIDSTLGLSSVGCIRGVVSMEDVIETMNSVEIVVKEEEELFFYLF